MTVNHDGCAGFYTAVYIFRAILWLISVLKKIDKAINIIYGSEKWSCTEKKLSLFDFEMSNLRMWSS